MWNFLKISFWNIFSCRDEFQDDAIMLWTFLAKHKTVEAFDCQSFQRNDCFTQYLKKNEWSRWLWSKLLTLYWILGTFFWCTKCVLHVVSMDGEFSMSQQQCVTYNFHRACTQGLVNNLTRGVTLWKKFAFTIHLSMTIKSNLLTCWNYDYTTQNHSIKSMASKWSRRHHPHCTLKQVDLLLAFLSI